MNQVRFTMFKRPERADADDGQQIEYGNEKLFKIECEDPNEKVTIKVGNGRLRIGVYPEGWVEETGPISERGWKGRG